MEIESNRANGGDSDGLALTEKNSATVAGEVTLADDKKSDGAGASPPAYGPTGGTTDAIEEGGDGAG